jgi:hypothetical protein
MLKVSIFGWSNHGLNAHRLKGSSSYFRHTAKKKGPSVSAKSLIFLPNLVGATRFELATPTMSRWCSNQLSYAPAKT